MKLISSVLFSAVFLLCASFIYAEDEEVHLKLLEPNVKWNFIEGKEFPGAKGSFKTDKDGAYDIGRLSFDFAGGGAYVGVQAPINIASGYSEFRFWVKAPANATILLRLNDQTGEVFQFNLPYTNAGEWQVLRVDLGGKPKLTFGGNKDGVWDYPLKAVLIGIDSGKKTLSGDLLFRDFSILK